MAELFRVKTFF